jgi:hypothetical protein
MDLFTNISCQYIFFCVLIFSKNKTTFIPHWLSHLYLIGIKHFVMKKILHSIFAALLCICLLNACKKGFNDQQSSLPAPQQPDLTTQARVSVSGFVTNENGQPVFNVLVTAGTASTSTDNNGYFKITNVLLSKTAPFISITKQGYFDSYRTFVYKENTENFTRIKLVPKTNAGTINAAAGGLVTTTDGGIVSLPANSVVNASTNAPYTGTVHVAAHVFKQDGATEFSATAPGDNRGISNDGYLQIRQSYGMLAVELTGDAGELLQIAPGKEATITTPIPASLTSSAPASIPLWVFDAAKGLWKQEGSTTKNGNNYVGKVSHFSFWDGAIGSPLVNLTLQVVNTALQPLGNVFVVIRKADDMQTGTSEFTNAQGNVSGAVLANTALVLELYSICDGTSLVYTQNFTTTNNDIDLGTIAANLGDLVTITGTAVNCNNAPVTDGWVRLFIGVTSYRLPITNGSFSFSTPSCSNMNASYVAIDYEASQQSMSQNITLVPGANDLGTIQACGLSSTTFIDYSIDNGPTFHITEPRDTMGLIGTYNQSSSETNIITVNRNRSLPYMNFMFTGNNSIGNAHTTDYFESSGFPTGFANAQNPPYTPLIVNITEFGAPGELIAGNFNGVVEDQNDHSQHTIHCEWRVRRYGN